VYQERASQLPGCVAWTRTDTSAVVHRVVPDGCLDVIWIDGTLVVAGPDTHAQLVTGSVGRRYLGIRFAPGVGATVLGVPANELRDCRVPLSAVWSAKDVARLAERIFEDSTGDLVLERFIAHRLRSGDVVDSRIPAVVQCLRAGSGVRETAAAVGLSERQLHRQSLSAFGYGPKTLARVLRLNRAIAMARQDVPFALIAAQAGYADQAHLARDVRALAGVSLGELTKSG
jgi:AraC-like DNA-binding protein